MKLFLHSTGFCRFIEVVDLFHRTATRIGVVAINKRLLLAHRLFQHADFFIVGGDGTGIVGRDPGGRHAGGERDDVAGKDVSAFGHRDVRRDLSGRMSVEKT